MKPILFLAGLLGTLASAQTAVQAVTEVSAQQAILRYRTPLNPASACSWAVTETISGATPDDVNTAIFSGSNLDTRPGSIVNGPDRAFVLGQRTSAQGLDGLLHSRSLKANTAYTATGTCSGSSPVTVAFTTQSIQAGATYLEQPPFNSNGYGNWAWPTINWSDQTKEYPDPQTGAVIKRVTSPGWWGQESQPKNFDYAIGGAGWTNPQNILQGTACGGGSGNCAQTTNANPIFLAVAGNNSAGYGQCISGYFGIATCDDILITLTGMAGAAGNAAVCLSYFDSGATCQSGSQTIALGTTLATTGFPAAGVGFTPPNNQWNPVFQFGEWGGPAPKRGDFGNGFGYGGAGTGVISSGTAITANCTNNSQSLSCFNVKWNNAYIYIQGSGCTDAGAGNTDVCQINGHPADTQHATLKNAPVNACASQCLWYSLASGIVVTPPGGSNQIDIGAQFSYATSAMFTLLAEGDQQICNPVPVPGGIGFQADGVTPINPPVPGSLCMLQLQGAGADETSANATLFLLIPSTGETRLLSPLFAPAGSDSADPSIDQNQGQIGFVASPWDGISGLCLYGLSGSTRGFAIYKGCYNPANHWKAYSHPAYACGNCFGWTPSHPGQDPTGSYPGQRWSDDPMVYTNIMPGAGKDIVSQVTANNPSFAANPTIWNNLITFDRILGGTAQITFSANPAQTQGMPQSINFFSTSTGNITAWGDTFFNYPTRFCGFHTSFGTRVAPGYWATACNYLDFPEVTLGGPYQSTPYYVYHSGVPSTNTALTSSAPLEACSGYSGIPANVQALITQQQGQNRCMHVRMKNVVNQNANSTESAAWPSMQHSGWSEPTVLQPGDQLSYGPTIGLSGGESGLVAAVTTGVTDSVCSSDCLDVVIVRGMINCSVQNFNCSPPTNQANSWVAVAGPVLGSCSGNVGECTPGVGVWFPATASGQLGPTGIVDPPAFGGHADGGPGPISGNMTFIQGGKARYNQTLAAQAGTFNNANQWVGQPPFAGNTGTMTLQSYVSNEQYNAPANQKIWSTDFRHTSPSLGGGGEEFIPIDAIAYSLAAGTSSVYHVTSPAGGLTQTEAVYKTNGLQGWAGHNLLQDVSGPGSALSDSSAYQVCMALAVGECRTGSSVGSVFTAVPNVPSLQSNCITDWLVENYPCVAMSLPSVTGWLVQNNNSYSYPLWEGGRRITSAFAGYGREYEFNDFIAESTGTWGMFKTDFADGIRSEILMAKLPPYSGVNSVPRSTWVNYPVQAPGGAAYAEIQFGYMENGSPQAYFCTSRQDACTTSGTPFAFPSIDTRTPLACASGCTINIPVIAGRAIYYSIGISSNGTSWTYGAPQVGLVP